MDTAEENAGKGGIAVGCCCSCCWNVLRLDVVVVENASVLLG